VQRSSLEVVVERCSLSWSWLILILLIRSGLSETVLLDDCFGLLVGGFIREVVFSSTLPYLFFLPYDYIVTLRSLPCLLLAR